MAKLNDASDPAVIYKRLRDQVLATTPGQLRLSPSQEYPSVWGVVMDTGYPGACVTLVSLADQTVSLYFGNGGGIIGGGSHANVWLAGKAFISASEYHAKNMKPADSFPLPAVGRVIFYVLTFSGVLTAECEQNTLVAGKERLSGLFVSANDVLTQLRLMPRPGASPKG